MKYVIITGGVTSSLGKGVVAASLGRLLKARDYRVILQKFDPYLNVDPGTMSPYQHGEVFVTEDGAETDLDLGHYERFVDINLNSSSNVTTGKIYQTILEKERRGDYLGSTVQVIPHVTDEIKKRLYKSDSQGDITITEIGGTVGDIESLPFLEAARQIKREVGPDNVVYVHVTLLPTLTATGEVKTKPTQHSVKELRSLGIQPDILICRTNSYGSLTEQLRRQKIAMFCDVEPSAVIENFDVDTVYELPRLLYEENFDTILLDKLHLPKGDIKLGIWEDIGYKFRALYPSHKTIGIIGKYTELNDAYISIVEALKHSFISIGRTMDIKMLSSEELETEKDPSVILNTCDGIIIPGGFGERGIEGKIKAIAWARINKVPCFGICLGMQAMVIETLRSAGFDANSTEFNRSTAYPVVDLLDNQDLSVKGGTMRLGSYHCHLIPGSKAKEIYGTANITERHRHRYEVNNAYRNLLFDNGLFISGTSPDCTLVEIVERKDHPWFLGCQFHPEFKSRPDRPHPLFKSFVEIVKGA